MRVELLGCTGAGKSSLAGGMMRAARERCMEIVTADECVLRRWRLEWVTSRFARTLCMDVICGWALLRSRKKNQAFRRFASGVIWRLPVARWQKANLWRNVLKKLAIYEMTEDSGGRGIVLVDEGTLQAAHNLFVHLGAEVSGEDVARFAKLVPVPEVAVYVRAELPALIERTQRRGHARIRDCSYGNVELFLSRAVTTFDRLWREAVLAERIQAVKGLGGLVVGAACDDGSLDVAVRVVRAGVDAGYRTNARGPSGFAIGC